MTEHTAPRLRKVEDLIREEPKRISMSTWVVDGFEEMDNNWVPPCNTVGCIAGWSLVQERIDGDYKFRPETHRLDGIPHYEIEIRARDYLGLTHDEASRLFFASNWPVQLAQDVYSITSQTPEYAEVVIARIEHFIATGGKE